MPNLKILVFSANMRYHKAVSNLVRFDIQNLAEVLRESDVIAFAFLFGSAQNGTVKPASDVDIAVWFLNNAQKNIENIFDVERLAEKVIDGRVIDVTALNTANPFLSFEALRGKLLFIRDGFTDDYTLFYNRTCRLYEEAVYRMKKQLEYRGHEVQWDN